MKQLAEQLYNKTKIKKTTLKFLIEIVSSIIEGEDVRLAKISSKLSGLSSCNSKIKKLQRFLDKPISMIDFMKMILSWFEVSKNIVLSIDRTNWKLGSSELNILMISIIVNGMGIPLCWSVLGRAGNSAYQDRINLLSQVIKIIPANKIQAIVGDREFIGKEWFNWLNNNNLPFCMRIKECQNVIKDKTKLKSGKLFDGEEWVELTDIEFCNIIVNLSGYNMGSDKLILACMKISDARKIYKMRWGIETLFQNLKGRGFNLELTHVTSPKRLSNLLICVCLAAIWCYKVGMVKNRKKAIKVKNHGRLSCSIFGYGLDEIQDVFRKVMLKEYKFKTIYEAIYYLLKPLQKLGSR
jgi:hypothetical protein